jgi:hypothetical protein
MGAQAMGRAREALRPCELIRVIRLRQMKMDEKLPDMYQTCKQVLPLC